MTNQTTRFAFVGFRHPHIFDMLDRCNQRPDAAVVAACEEDAPTRDALASANKVHITHSDFDHMLRETDADVIAIGDYYANRGSLAIRALQAGRHVVADKPLCTTLDELDQITRLAADRRKLVHLMLDMRDSAVFLGLRQLIAANEIGPVRAISFNGQHPLNFGSRAPWYFEPHKHGGTLNDIAIHALDMIPWITGSNFKTLHAARCWHHLPPSAPHFQGCGQLMATLDNNAGVLGDVSYLSPDSFGYTVPYYWRFNFWGDGGMIEAAYNAKSITLYKAGEKEPRQVPLPDPRPGAYLDAFLAELRGQTTNLHLSSADSLRAARTALLVQHAADHNQFNIPLA